MSKMQKRGRPATPPKTSANQRNAMLNDNPRKTHGHPASDKDPKGRLGNFATAGEHAIQQPSGKNGGRKNG